MFIRLIVLIACSVVIAAASLFGLFYNPGHPWLDTKRKIGVAVICAAFALQMLILIVSHL